MGLTPSFRLPIFIPAGAAHDSVRSAIQSHDNSITDLNQAIAAQASDIAALKPSTTSTASGASTTTQVSTENVTNNTTISGGVVNNQSGNTTYSTAQGDNGALIILSDASPVAVTLNNSVTIPWYCFVLNAGVGLVTLTPQQNLINGAASENLTEGLFSAVFYDGTNFWAAAVPIVPETFAAVAHQFLNSYDAATGLFTAAQPGFSDISGTASTSQIGTGTPVAGDYVDGGTGAWTALPGGLSVTITTAALTVGGTQGSQTFTGGRLSSQVQAT